MQKSPSSAHEKANVEAPEVVVDVFPSDERSSEEPSQIQVDLYPIGHELSAEDSQTLTGFSEEATQHLEPSYEAFLCPLTKKIMDEPVSIETGVTFERTAIFEWFNKFEANKDIFCPLTGKKLSSRHWMINVALKFTITEWRKRNVTARIKFARAALSIASSYTMVMEAIKDMSSLCENNTFNKSQVCSTGMLPLLTQLLGHEDRNIICAVLEFLKQLADNDDKIKGMIAEIIDVPEMVRVLSGNHQASKNASLLLLHELSTTKPLSEKIGEVAGAILMLITVKYRPSVDALASKKADEILKNLELYPYNIKLMAENGFLEPLLKNLMEGSDEMKVEMASYLNEIVLGHDSKIEVAEQASTPLIKMVQMRNPLSRSAAFKALMTISSYQLNSKKLVDVGILPVVVKEIFSRQIYNEPVKSCEVEAASILANIYESGISMENQQVNAQGHTMTSDYVLYNIISMVRCSTEDELIISLIRILLCLTKTPKSLATITDVVKQTEASYTLIELINNPNDVLVVANLKLLILLSPYIGHILAEKLCKTYGQPGNLIQIISVGTTHITEKQALSVKFLAKLPHQNTTLNQALLDTNKITAILQTIDGIRRIGMRSRRHGSIYMEGLVGIIVRFTATLSVPQILGQAKVYNFTSLLSELLEETSSDEVQRFAAMGLENLSSQSINLSKPLPPKVKESKISRWVRNRIPLFRSSKRRMPICLVHRGACSSQNTFCLIDANSVERLLECLHHENPEVVEAALSAICTLLDDKVDVEKSVNMLLEFNALHQVLNLIKEHGEGGLQHKSFWIIDRFLLRGGVKSMNHISQDKLLPAILVSSLHHGNDDTRRMAEKILRHLNMMPTWSPVNYNR